MNINVVIFSKDRACQLDALMRSIRDQVVGWDKLKYTVVFYSSSGAFQKGYDIVRAKPYGRYYRMVRQVNKSLKQFVIEAINPQIPYTVFFVDDDVFIRKWDPEDGKILTVNDKQVAALSLRMDNRYDYCYTQGRSVAIPTLTKEMKWKWGSEMGDWGYPMSLDGHIFRTNEIIDRIQAIQFEHPNTMEGGLASHPPIESPYLVGYERAKILNIPVNKVQTINQNRAGTQVGFSVDSLNDLYLQGKSIVVDKLYNVDSANAPHYEMDLTIQ